MPSAAMQAEEMPAAAMWTVATWAEAAAVEEEEEVAAEVMEDVEAEEDAVKETHAVLHA